MPATTSAISNESIVVLNESYQYDSSNQALSATWIDLSNVLSVKRDKTIYAIRARNNYNFSGNNNTQFFANTVTAYQLPQVNGDYFPGTIFTSSIYRGFGTVSNGTVNILDAIVYGNINAGLGNLGISGSLNKNFTYQAGTINVQSNVTIRGNLTDTLSLGGLPAAFAGTIDGNILATSVANGTTANVNGNATCYQNVQYSDSSVNPWNRLINATLGSAAFVNASTDPCDLNGSAVNNARSTSVGTASTNEAYRHQFQLRKNNKAASSQNPIYIARISRFGQRLSDNKSNAIASNLTLNSFTSNLFASIPSDNSLYAGANVITGLNITGNINATSLVVFNSNFASGQLYPAGGVSGNFNGTRTDNLDVSNNNSVFMTITERVGSIDNDYIQGGAALVDLSGNINTTGTFVSGDRFGLVQANVALTQGYMLLDRIAFKTTDPLFIKSSTVFSQRNDLSNTPLTGNLTTNYQSLWFSSNMWTSLTAREISSKYLVVKGANIIANNWQATPLMTPSSLLMPVISGNPNLTYYTVGNTINLYLRRGDMSMRNNTYINNKTVTGVKYITTVPQFINNVVLPVGNIVLSKNILENGADMTATATNQVPLALLSNALANVQANVSCNYDIIFSGNVNVDNRVDKHANIVCPVNYANSFIADCWNYDVNGVTVNSATNVISDVSIAYGGINSNTTTFGGQVIPALRLDSELAKYNITYNLEFTRATGSTNSSTILGNDNFVFYANLNSNGGAPLTGLTSVSANALTVAKLNNNDHINSINLNGVAYSEYGFSSQSYKFTDANGVLGTLVPGTNYNYTYILPAALTQSSVTSLPSGNVIKNTSDSHMNLIVDYLVFQTLPTSNNSWHEVTCYNTKYRYGVDAVTVQNGSAFNNNLLLNNVTFNPTNLYASAGVSPQINGNLEAAAVSCYVYENVDSNTTTELLYPFTTITSNSTAPGNNYANALFPGFKYSSGAGNTYSLYGPKLASECDLILPNNSFTASSVSVVIQSQDISAGTFKVGLSNGVAKTLYIKPVPHGYSSAGAQKYATPVVCAITGESNSYVILMVECAGSTASGGLTTDISANTPINIKIGIIENTPATLDFPSGRPQLTMNASLRVFDANNVASTVVYDNYIIKTPISNYSFVSSSNGSLNQNAQLGVNIYSVPANGSILSFIYQQDVVKRVLSYSRTDYSLNDTNTGYNGNTLVYQTTFAFSKENNSPSYLSDGIFPSINPYATRYYLDTKASGIFIDISINSIVSADQMGLLRVDRSVEWVLTRSYNTTVNESVGRGLMSRNSADPASYTTTYYIYENTTTNGSGYCHAITTNLVNLASRCILQKLQTNAFCVNGVTNKNNWVITTLSDSLNIMVVRINSTTGQLFSSTMNDNIIKQATVKLIQTNQTIDLGLLLSGSVDYANSFVNLLMGPIRGFGFNPAAAAATLNTTLSMFSLRVQPDCYCLVSLQPGVIGGTQGSNVCGSNVLFSLENNVKSVYLNDFALSFQNASLAYQYLNSNTLLSTSAFTVIGTYVYNGLGKVSIWNKDFTSNYSNLLNSNQKMPASGNLAPVGDGSAAWAVDNVLAAADQQVNICYDSVSNKYYFNLDENVNGVNASDRVYFRGTGSSGYPTQFNGKTSLLLYSGLRPVVINVLEVASDNTLQACITAASMFNWNSADVNNTNAVNIFTNLSSGSAISQLPGAALTTQYYQVVLTNQSAASSALPIIFRQGSYTLKTQWFQPFSIFNLNKNFFGSYNRIASMFSGLRLNIQRSAGVNTSYDMTTIYLGKLPNSQANDSTILDGQKGLLNSSDYLFPTFKLIGASSNADVLGDLFNVTVLSSLAASANFILNILPAQLDILTATDANNNGEIDTQIDTDMDHAIVGVTTKFGLNNMFSELNYVLPPLPSTNSYKRPQIIASWALDRNFNSVPIPGCPFDIKINNRWAVGYNLDCYFAINNSTSAQFDVITIATKQTTSASGTILNSLEVQSTAPLVIQNQSDWARSLLSQNGQADNKGIHSGLTFKITNGVTNVVAGSVVRLFVDNTISSNFNEWTVSTATSSNKTYKLYSYDQDRYAALLNEQLSINNNFS